MKRRLPKYFATDYRPLDPSEVGLPDDHPMVALLNYAYNLTAQLEERVAELERDPASRTYLSHEHFEGEFGTFYVSLLVRMRDLATETDPRRWPTPTGEPVAPAAVALRKLLYHLVDAVERGGFPHPEGSPLEALAAHERAGGWTARAELVVYQDGHPLAKRRGAGGAQ